MNIDEVKISNAFKNDLIKIIKQMQQQNNRSAKMADPFSDFELCFDASPKAIMSFLLKDLGVEAEGNIFIIQK